MAQHFNFAAMSVDALWQLHEEMRVVLAAKMAAQQQEIDERLRDLEEFPAASKKKPQPDSKPAPVYRNPSRPSQTWSGRGLRPRWLLFKIAAGHTLDEFLSEADSTDTVTSRGAKPKKRA
jgi:DNA-binding protein H-NS